MQETITMTRDEFVALIQRVQDLAVMGCFIFIKGMKSDNLKNMGQDCSPKTEPKFVPTTVYASEYKPRTRFTAEEKKRIIEDYRAGMDVPEIVKKYKLKTGRQVYGLVSSHRRIFGKNSLPKRKAWGKWSLK